jgi:hypothetical protein
MTFAKTVCFTALAGVCVAMTPLHARASSHREAPLITTMPKTDGTDFYMFSSYESGHSGDVTLVADYQPLEDPFAGPNYYTMDPTAAYDININNTAARCRRLPSASNSPIPIKALRCR